MTTLYITRHGQTLWNIEERWQGWLDSPLSSKGIEEAKKLGAYIKNLDIDIIYSSPLKRASDTSDLINTTKNIKVILDDRLKEIGLGEWEGKTLEEIKLYDFEHYKNYTTKSSAYNKEGGESFFQVENRVAEFLNDILKNSGQENILIVTHGIIAMVILNYISKKHIDSLRDIQSIKNCSLSIVEYENNSYEIIEKNKVDFL